MFILGICNDETASACLMRDGEIIFAASEERFTRRKLDNSFPHKSIEACLEYGQIELQDVDIIAYAWAKGLQQDLAAKLLGLGARYANNKEAFEIAQQRIKVEIDRDKTKRQEFDNWVADNIDPDTQKVLDFYHHEAHAASAAFYSPFNSGFVYTSDGRGDFEATTIYKFERYARETEKLKKIYSATSTDSFGFFYGRITGLLGFTPMRHEGKVTGLAAYGDASKAYALCRQMIDVYEGDVKANLGDYYRPFFAPYSEPLKEEISLYDKQDVAASAQQHLENMMVNLLEFHIKDSDVTDTNLMCAGGVFGNVKITQRLKEIKEVRKCYVQPQMGDGGLCLGACALAFEKINPLSQRAVASVKSLTSMYLGPKPSYRHPASTHESSRICHKKIVYAEAALELAKSLERGNVIGLINGRMEFGPRALCNRSIIYPTSDKTINDWLNTRLKRTEFMPFAPVLREEVAADCISEFDNSDITLRFMTATVNCTSTFEEKNPAVVHIDKTARPQVVTAESNNFIWNVLCHWEIMSGEQSLVNTSFNAHEEPIICDIDEGIKSLRDDVIDQLWVIDDNRVDVYLKQETQSSGNS